MQSYFIGIREFKLRVQTSNGKRQGKKKITLQSIVNAKMGNQLAIF
jgi:hypothetical protein